MENDRLAIFEGPTGALHLEVEGYQFPDVLNDEWDSNWLIITADAVLDGKSWRFRDPCLTTFELQRLAGWLDQVAAGTAEQNFCGFTEPNLDFERVSDVSIRIGLSLEALPPWANQGGDLGDVGFEVPIGEQLKTAAASLRRFLSKFPVRATGRCRPVFAVITALRAPLLQTVGYAAKLHS